MDTQEVRNQKIINAVLEKERSLCPGAVALIGIYGSFQTGDVHPLSDLDLLILINDDRGWALQTAFLLDDAGVGYDIYCTGWDSLRRDAEYTHPHISNLMDASIVYCADEKYLFELEALREQAKRVMDAPFAEADLKRAEDTLKEARLCYAQAMASGSLPEARVQAGGALYCAEDALTLLNKTYYKKGVHRRYEELAALQKRPADLCGTIEGVVCAKTLEELQQQLKLLMKALSACFDADRLALKPEKRPADQDALRGTYEEMFSNWHGKMHLALQAGDRHLAFMTLESLHQMLADIGEETDIQTCSALSAYDPCSLERTLEAFDAVLNAYLKEYEKASLKVNRFDSADDFTRAYLSGDDAG